MNAIETTVARQRERTSTEIVLAVADTLGKDPLEIEPLYDVINPDALNALFTETRAGDPRSVGHTFFTLEGCGVLVYSDGKIVVVPPEE